MKVSADSADAMAALERSDRRLTNNLRSAAEGGFFCVSGRSLGLRSIAVARRRRRRYNNQLVVRSVHRRHHARGLYWVRETSRMNMVMSNIILVVVRLSVLVVESGQLFSPRYP